MSVNMLPLTLALSSLSAYGQPAAHLAKGASPIRRVVTLIEDMKATVEKEGKADEASYDKFACWCSTGEEEKTKAIAAGKARIEELTAFIEEAAGTEAELKTEVEALADDLAEDKDALKTARAMRDKEHEEFSADEDDMKQTLSGLTGAIEILSKVQLTQKSGGRVAPQEEAEALLQVRKVVRKHWSSLKRYQGVMQKDLYDMLDSFQSMATSEDSGASSDLAANTFLGEVFLGKADAVALDQATSKQAKKQPTGAAAGAKSYSSQSGQIFGILNEMKDEFSRDLGAAQKEELKAVIGYHNLNAAKTGEIAAAEKQKKEKEVRLSSTVEAREKAKEDLEATTEALEEDEKILNSMDATCKTMSQEYEARQTTRGEELVALSDTIQILSADDARDLFAKTMSFVQIRSSTSAESTSKARMMMEDRLKQKAMTRLASTAKKTNSWALASLAINVRMDSFTKVQVMLDKMLTKLKKQQQDEYEKVESCKTELDKTEDSIKEAKIKERDLDEKFREVTNTVDTLKANVEALKTDVKNMEVQLKQAGINRHEENTQFLKAIHNQRATAKVLQMAYKRLQKFYQPELVQVQAHSPVDLDQQPATAAYEKSGGASSALQLIMKVITDAESEEKQLSADEQSAQQIYASFVAESAASIEADRETIAENQKHVAQAEATLSETRESQLATEEALESLNGLLNGVHQDCDFVMKYFKLRQKARGEEMNSIEDAKAILSGADFGK